MQFSARCLANRLQPSPSFTARDREMERYNRGLETVEQAEARPRAFGPGKSSRWYLRFVSGALGLVVCAGGTGLLYANDEIKGDPDLGARAYRTSCAGCHSIERNRIGPRHAGVVGRRAATQPGYTYSSALQESRIRWTPRQLDRWLTNPRDLVPGTRMATRISSAKRRQDIIAYLETQ